MDRITSGSDAGALPRALGPFSATCVVIGAIVGVGIFFTPSKVAALAGSPEAALLAWGVGGGIALCGALTFAALGVRYPLAGGQYDVLRDAWGSFAGFLYVFCNATAIQAGAIAVIALICAENLPTALLGRDLSEGWRPWIGGGLVVVLTIANVAGVRWGSGVQNATVVAKLAAIAGIVLLAALVEGPATAAGPDGSSAAPTAATAGASLLDWRVWLMLPAAIVPVFFAYGGWQQGLWMAGEVRSPTRNLPIAIVGGVLVVIGVYVAVNWAFLHLLGYGGVVESRALAADAAGRVWPDAGRRLMAAAVAISALGVLNAQLLAGPRLLYRLASDGQFFSIFARVHPRFRTPWAAIVLLGALGLVLMVAAGKDGADRIVTGVVCVDSVFFVLTGAAAVRLAWPRARAGGPRLGQPWAAVLFVIGETAVVIGSFMDPATRSASLIGIAWIFVAGVFYLGFRRAAGRAAG